MTGRRRRERRLLHPGAWWVWALGCGAAALRTTNPLVLLLVLASVVFVVASRRPDAPWARSFGGFLRLGVAVIVIRVAFQVLFGNRLPGTTLVTLPSVTLPSWAAGVSLGGPVTLEAVVGAAYEGLRLAVVIACFGAATSLCSPYRLLRAVPSVLYEAGVAVTVALTFAPQAAVAAGQVRAARRLRGRRTRGLAGLRGLALPVLEGALERSVALAASMDSRGYGRRGATPPAVRRLASGLVLAGMLLAAIGAYGVLDAGAPAALGLPVLALAALSLAGSLVMGGRRHARTRYRPDPWRAPEWLVSACGVAVVAGMVVAGRSGELSPSVYPLEVPGLPVAALLAAVAAAIPAWAAPEPPPLGTVEAPAVATPAGRRSRRAVADVPVPEAAA